MRILYFADIRFPLERANGMQTMATCHALVERGHTVRLVVRPDTQTPARDPFAFYGLPHHDGLIVERAPIAGASVPPFARRPGYLAFAAGRAAGRGRADVIMTRDLTTASLVLRLPMRAPLVYESHGYAPDVAAALPDLLATAAPASAAKLSRLARREAFVWRHADGYVTITSGLRDELTRRFGGRERVAVVPDGARVAAACTPRDPQAPFTVAYAGHLYAWKGVDILLDALALLPGVRALVVGGHDKEPDLARLRAQSAALGLDSRVTFTGQVPPAAVPERLAGADVLVLPNPASAISTHATSPLKLFEYMAAGRAIVASDLPAIREVLTHGENAVLVPPGDAAALANGIRNLEHAAVTRARLADAARAAVTEYSWARRAERLESLFAAVVNAAGPPRR